MRQRALSLPSSRASPLRGDLLSLVAHHSLTRGWRGPRNGGPRDGGPRDGGPRGGRPTGIEHTEQKRARNPTQPTHKTHEQSERDLRPPPSWEVEVVLHDQDVIEMDDGSSRLLEVIIIHLRPSL